MTNLPTKQKIPFRLSLRMLFIIVICFALLFAFLFNPYSREQAALKFLSRQTVFEYESTNTAPGWLRNIGLGDYFERVHSVSIAGPPTRQHLRYLFNFNQLKRLTIHEVGRPVQLDILAGLGITELHYSLNLDPNNLELEEGFNRLQILEWSGTESSQKREEVAFGILQSLKKLRLHLLEFDRVNLGAKELEVIRLENCKINELANFAGLSKLLTLRLANVRGLMNLEGFRDNTQLQRVILHDMPDLTQFAGAQAMPGLKTAVFLNCPKLKSVNGLNRVEQLCIRNCPRFTDLNALLRTQPNLKVLDLTDNQQFAEFDFENLKRCERLEVLHVSGIGLSPERLLQLKMDLPNVQILSNKKLD